MHMTTGSTKTIALLAAGALALSALASACKSPLFGLGGQVDTAVPGITVSEVEEGGIPRTLVNGDYVRGSITLRGGTSDDLGISTVSLSFADSGATATISATINSTAQTWEAIVDTTAYLDGDKDFTVTVTDTAGKTSTTRFVLYFDNKPPTVLLSVPSADEGTEASALYGVIDIKGSAADQFGIRKVRVFVYDAGNALLYSSPDDASIGTNSFALRLDTSSLLGKTGVELGYIYVRAWDRSGNTNVQFYRLDEIKALNANQGATVEELHALETGSATSANNITLAQAAGARRYQPGTGYDSTKLIGYRFDQSSNLPIITISNPEEGNPINLLSKSAKAMGLVQDANGVALVEIQFKNGAQESIWYSDPDDTSAGHNLDVSGSGRVVNWSTKILYGSYADSGFGALDVASYSLRIRATDTDGNVRVSDWVSFTIDADVPDIAIGSPGPGDYLTGATITFSGEAHSYGTATVDKVELSINGLFDYTAATCTPASGAKDVTWTFGLTDTLVPDDGTYTVKARVTDSGVKQAIYNIVVTVDRTIPYGLAFISPTKGSSVNGYPMLKGQANDNVLLKEVRLIFEKKTDDNEVPLGDTYNWSYELDAGTLANETYGYAMGNNIYRVPFRIKAIDQADNEAWSPPFGADEYAPGAGSYYLDVDLDGDKPEITNIIAPGGENLPASPYLIPGSIKFQGTATDDDRLHHVEMALIALSGGSESWRTLNGLTEVPVDTYYAIGSSTLWSSVLNESGDLYALADVPGHSGDFKIIVRAVDTKDLISPAPAAGITGDPKTIFVRFDNTLPGVVDLLPAEGAMKSGTFMLTFTAQDNLGVVEAKISYNNGSSYSALAMTAGTPIPLSVSINSKTVNAGAFATSSGTLYMRIYLKDTTGNITEKSFKYLVDNIAPVDKVPPSPATMAAISNDMYTDAGASLAEILGVVDDTGTVRGIKKVEAYFERGGQIYRLNPNKAASSIPGKDYTFSNGATALYPYDSVADDRDDYKIIVDKAENYIDATVSGGDEDGYQESITQGSTGYTWGARFDSEKISDGDVTVHYVAWDEAGNSSHFSVPGVVRNNPPILASIILGTNLNGDMDATDDGERVRLEKQADGTWRGYTLKADGSRLGLERAYDLSQPILTVRNNRFTFSSTVDGGNPPLAYRSLSPDGATPLLNWSPEAGYTTTDFSAGGWTEDATNSLTVQARDSAYGTALLTENLTFRVAVDNIDGTPPELLIAPIGSLYASPVPGQSMSYVDRSESAVGSYPDNIYWIDANGDGQCSREDRQGHVELATDSQHGGLDADVSGIVLIRGKAYDDQRIGRLTVAFDVDFDANGSAAGGVISAGTQIELATFITGSLSATDDRAAALNPVSNALHFELLGKNTPEIDDELGHTANYTLTWNTAFISGVAEDDVTMTIRAYNNDSSQSTQRTLTVDVVPYITAIERSSSYNTLRSRYGRYLVFRGETVTVRGFNVWNSGSDTARFGLDSAVTIPSGNATSFGIAVPGTARSGEFTLTVNGVTALNNVNADRPYNRESSASPSLDGSGYWDDDRSLHVWRSDSSQGGSDRGYFTGSVDPEYPAMSMDPATGILYGSWSNYASSNVLYAANNGSATTIYHSYDPLEHTDIDFGARATVVYNANTYGNSSWDQEGAGGVQIWDANAPASYDSTNWMGNPQNSGYAFYGMEELYHDQKLMQFTNQRVATFGTGAGSAIHIAYFDTDTKSLKYAYVANSSTNRDENQTWINVDGGSDEHDGTRIVAAGRSAAAGEFNAIDTTPTGNPVIAYYDITNQTLKLARASAANPTAAQWTLQTVMDNETAITPWKDPNYRYSGKYVAMKIDAAGYLHLAFYRNSTGDLVYTKSTNNPSSGGTAYAFGPSVIVDSIGSVGVWADLTVYEPTPGSTAENDARPCISYLDSSLANTFDGIKVAYWDPALDRETETLVSGATDDATQPDSPDGWETMNAAMTFEVENVRTGIEWYNDSGAPPDSDYSIRIGYSSTDYYRIGYYVD